MSRFASIITAAATAPPPIPLQWVPTDRRTHPKLTSSGAEPTIALGPAQSGSSFDGIAIDKPTVLAVAAGSDALQVGAALRCRLPLAVARRRDARVP